MCLLVYKPPTNLFRLLGGTGAGADTPSPRVVQSNVECDPMNNFINDIRGIVMTVNGDFDAFVMASGAFMCVESSALGLASWSLRYEMLRV